LDYGVTSTRTTYRKISVFVTPVMSIYIRNQDPLLDGYPSFTGHPINMCYFTGNKIYSIRSHHLKWLTTLINTVP